MRQFRDDVRSTQVGVIALGLAADVLIPRAGAIKRDDAHANYVAGRDYTKKLRSKKDE